MVKAVRSSNIELLRIVSMVMIMFLHCFGQGQILKELNSGGGGGVNYYVAWAVEAFCYVSVNCYVLISGYFLIESQFKGRKIVILWVQILFYSLTIFAVLVAAGVATLDVKSLAKAAFPVITKPWWFASIYLGLYALSPFFNIGLKRLSKKQHGYLLGVGALMFCLPYDTFNVFNGYSLIWFIYLYCLAAYFRLYKPQDRIKTKALVVVFVAGCSTIALSRFILEMAFGFSNGSSIPNMFYAYSSIFCLLSACALFLLFLRVRISASWLSAGICKVAGLTFGIFLIHSHFALRDVLWVSLGSQQFVDPSVPPLAFLPLMLITVLGVFTVCGLIEWLRQKLFAPFERWDGIDRALLLGKNVLNRMFGCITGLIFAGESPSKVASCEDEQVDQKQWPH